MGAAKSLATNEGAELVRRCRAGDGAAWGRQFEQFMGSAEHSFGVLSAELWSRQGLSLARKAYGDFGRRGLLEFAGHSLVSARDWLGATFASERAHGLQLNFRRLPGVEQSLQHGSGPDEVSVTEHRNRTRPLRCWYLFVGGKLRRTAEELTAAIDRTLGY